MLYQINTRALLNEIARDCGRSVTLDDIPDAILDRWRSMGFEWIWLLSVWQTGDAARQVSRSHHDWQRDFERTLPDLREDDIQGSGFAITNYHVQRHMGGDESLARLRDRMHSRGLKLMLDFVPNHMAPDHVWIEAHPEWFITGTEELLRQEPQNYFRHPSGQVFAFGRDPYFSGWPDTIQLDYSSPALLQAMAGELQRIASQCDGVRCDMAMLIQPDVFQRTWGRPALPFWGQTIEQIKNDHPTFCFLAEVYWDREWELQQLDFDYCYDKRLYDRLLHENARSVHMHLVADLDYQNRLARFLENHDEPRIASVLEKSKHFAAAIVCYLTPGLQFFHEGQFDGRRTKISPHLVRRPAEEQNHEIASFYERLRELLKHPMRTDGKWLLLDAKPAWDGNTSHESLICFRWKSPENRQLVVAVNYSDKPSQGRLRINIDSSCVNEVVWHEWMTNTPLRHHRGELFNPGMLLDLAPWEYRVLLETDG